jgi:hypothetical protein
MKKIMKTNMFNSYLSSSKQRVASSSLAGIATLKPATEANLHRFYSSKNNTFIFINFHQNTRSLTPPFVENLWSELQLNSVKFGVGKVRL